jgi:hypothetical protein
MRGRKGYSLLGLFAVLFVAVAFLPSIRRMFVRSFPEGFQARMVGGSFGGSGVDSRRGDCKGITCQEGEFCQENTCRPVMPPITNDYFSDN